MNTALEPLTPLLLGLAAGLPISILGVRRGYIDTEAAALALAFSCAYFLLSPGVLLAAIAFFLSSSLLTKHGYSYKQKIGAAEPPGGRRWTQVLGAGGIAALFSLLPSLGLLDTGRATLAALAALAASNADTWAAELGALYGGQPRLITRPWEKVPPGLSGGVTLAGELGSLAGSTAIALTALAASTLGLLQLPPSSVASIALAGYIGELVDSLVGATLQAKYLCPACNKLTDKEVHSCGARTLHIGGIKCFKNETTNIVSTLAASLAALAL